MAIGYIHSVESMGLVDGPGIRTVVFLQGCNLRCQYCHNPDTWEIRGERAQQITPEELVAKLCRFKPYYGTEGGVTFSGGEPLLQPEFLLECLKLCHQKGINTCLDTAGCGMGDYEEILKYIDLILMDIKEHTPQGFQKITRRESGQWEHFLEVVQRLHVPMWIRHVVVPGLTDGDEHLASLEDYLKSISHIRRVELLPYHTLGVHKYHEMGISYPLEGVPPMDGNSLIDWQKRINDTVTHIENEEENL